MHKKITNIEQLPLSLRSRQGWAELFEIKRSPEPHIHQIEPTNHCPYHCIMCPRPTKMTRELGFMEIELYKTIIDEISSFTEPVKSLPIELFHFGESLLHPQLPEMVRYGTARNLNLILSVNGPQLTPDLSLALLDANPSQIIVSLDGYDQNSYQAIRGKAADYSKAQLHIDFLLQQRKKHKGNTGVIVRMIQLEKNRGKRDAFKTFWQQRGAEVEFRPFFPWTEEEFKNLGDYNRYPPYMPCPFPWQYMVVQWDGSVVPCCRDYNAENVLGSVKKSSLRDIWNSSSYTEFRKQHTKTDLQNNRICSSCMQMYSSED